LIQKERLLLPVIAASAIVSYLRSHNGHFPSLSWSAQFSDASIAGAKTHHYTACAVSEVSRVWTPKILTEI
jgi:hypothetical protein